MEAYVFALPFVAALEDAPLALFEISGHLPSAPTGQLVEVRLCSGTSFSRVATSTCESSTEDTNATEACEDGHWKQ
jgi:hypothetical protein